MLANLLAPIAFVLLWSTGFILTKYGLPYAEPFTFLTIRFWIVAMVLALFAIATRASWPKQKKALFHIAVVGILAHGLYLGGAFAGMATGINAGVSALLVGIQPLLTAVLAGPMLGERVTRRQWAGLLLGFFGIALVVLRYFGDGADGTSISSAGLFWHIVAVVGITLSVLYQKRFCADMSLRTGTCIQFTAAAFLVTVLALLLEDNTVVWSGRFVFALSWLSFVLSIGAVTLLWILVRRDAAANVASLFYLVPPTTAIIAWFMFGETVTLFTAAGMGFVAFAIILVNTTPGSN